MPLARVMDLPKAYDTLGHISILHKLISYGIRGPVHHWVQTYLSDRPYVSKINNVVSSSSILECGVPQGSILEPLFFLVYVNNITRSVINSQLIIYADDCTCLLAEDIHEKAVITANKELARLAS